MIIEYCSEEDFYYLGKISTRSHNQAKHFDAKEVYIYPMGGRKTLWRTSIRYMISTGITLWCLIRARADVVFCLNQPPPLVILVSIYSFLTGRKYILDSHSGAFNDPRVSWFLLIYKRIARRAMININTNQYHRFLVEEWGGRSVVISDVPIDHHKPYKCLSLPDPSIIVVASYMFDEPIGEIVEATRRLPDVSFFMTGDPRRLNRNILESLPDNMMLTGFVSRDEYFSYLSSAKAVMVLTTRDNTMQMGAYEALSLEQPIITSDWKILRESFGDGAVYVDNSVQGIVTGVEQLLDRHADYRAAITTQKTTRREYFEECKKEIFVAIGRLTQI